jgi:ribosomal protein S18 acetylase RimI-like enzyme
MNVRPAEEGEVDYLADLWHACWHESHPQFVPPELTRLRTLDNFRSRLQSLLRSIRVVGPSGAPLGFCIVKDDELYQLFVSPQVRGSGVAASLIADAEEGLAQSGVATAWLACAIGNERAARFYEKSGWHRVGTMVDSLETSIGKFPLEVWRYEKRLR